MGLAVLMITLQGLLAVILWFIMAIVVWVRIPSSHTTIGPTIHRFFDKKPSLRPICKISWGNNFNVLLTLSFLALFL